MKTLVIGLDCAAPELLLCYPELTNFRKLMDGGVHGRLESVVPPITVPAWMCMSTSQDPGSLGVYGFRNRTDHTYHRLGVVDSSSFKAPAIWDSYNNHGLPAIVVGVPPSYPPRRILGANVGCFLTPDTTRCEYTYPAELKHEFERLVGEYPVDVKGFRTDNKAWLLEQIYDMSRKQFEVVRYLLTTRDWEYFHFVEIGLDRIHHGFWRYHDPLHRHHQPGSAYENTIRHYYQHLDEEVGKVLELIDDDTVVLVVSDHGAQRLDGGFCVNQWLCQEGLLVLNDIPSKPTPFSPSMVDWTRTRVWSEGGYYARIFFNVEGREPNGVISPLEYESFRTEMTQRLEALPDDTGRPMGTKVFVPDQIYRSVKNIPPDLIVHFGNLFWRSIGGIGYDCLHIQENDTGPDDCNHAQFGSFILNGGGVPAAGALESVHLLDIAPTLLQLAGLPAGEAMQGRNFLSGAADSSRDKARPAVDIASA